MKKNASDFLESVYVTYQSVGNQKALDLIYDFIEENLKIGNYEIVDQAIKNVDIEKISDPVSFGFLATTIGFKSDLPSRIILINKLQNTITESRVINYLKNLS